MTPVNNPRFRIWNKATLLSYLGVVWFRQTVFTAVYFLATPSEEKSDGILLLLQQCKGKRLIKFHTDLLNYVDIPVMAIHGRQKQQKRINTFYEFNNAEKGTSTIKASCCAPMWQPEDWTFRMWIGLSNMIRQMTLGNIFIEWGVPVEGPTPKAKPWFSSFPVRRNIFSTYCPVRWLWMSLNFRIPSWRTSRNSSTNSFLGIFTSIRLPLKLTALTCMPMLLMVWEMCLRSIISTYKKWAGLSASKCLRK